MKRFVHTHPTTSIFVVVIIGATIIVAANSNIRDAINVLVVGSVVSFGFWMMED